MHIPAPKPPLPGHNESYNPPPEYLPTPTEVDIPTLLHSNMRRTLSAGEAVGGRRGRRKSKFLTSQVSDVYILSTFPFSYRFLTLSPQVQQSEGGTWLLQIHPGEV